MLLPELILESFQTASDLLRPFTPATVWIIGANMESFQTLPDLCKLFMHAGKRPITAYLIQSNSRKNNGSYNHLHKTNDKRSTIFIVVIRVTLSQIACFKVKTILT